MKVPAAAAQTPAVTLKPPAGYRCGEYSFRHRLHFLFPRRIGHDRL
jgi:hypothetical protein